MRRATTAKDLWLAPLSLGTAWAACLAWRGLSERSAQFLIPLLFAAVVLAATGVTLRALRLPTPLVGVVQTLVAATLGYLLIAPRPFELSDTGLSLAWADAVESAGKYAAPVSAQAPSISPLLIAAGLGVLWLVELIANISRRPAASGLALLAALVLPTAARAEPAGWFVFAVVSAGYLVLLYAHHDDRVESWGTRLIARETTADTVTNAATVWGAVAITTALAGAWVIPTWQLAQFGGDGQGKGQDSVSVVNPITDLQRDLRRGRDVPLIRVTTDDPSPDYLRIAVLTRFRNSTWSTGNRTLPAGQRADGPMPEAVGLDPLVPRRTHDYSFEVTEDFRSTWLPTPTLLTRIEADGRWQYDRETMDFLATETGLNTAGLRYQASASEPRLDARTLARSPISTDGVSATYLQLPTDLPQMVIDLATEVTEGQPSKFQEATALQRWFRAGGGFRYSLKTAPGNGVQALTQFLSEGSGGRVGYCEQFASAMAVMARTRGIPSRVAVGFLRPEPQSPGVFEYSSHDLHAWPELFFPGAGWVRFEPTPGDRASAPGYTTQRLPQQVVVPTVTASREPGRPGRDTPREQQLPTRADSETTDGPAWTTVIVALGGIATVAGLAAVPALIRRQRRRRALTDPTFEGLWRELRDSCVDLGRTWPSGRSPRESGEVIAQWLGDGSAPGLESAPARDALDRLVSRLEQHRYSPSPGVAGAEDVANVSSCLDALQAAVGSARRRRAVWWPASVLSRHPRPAAGGKPQPGRVVESGAELAEIDRVSSRS